MNEWRKKVKVKMNEKREEEKKSGIFDFAVDRWRSRTIL